MFRIFNLYTSKLQTHPKITNALSTGFLFGLGDVIAQVGFPTTTTTTTTTASTPSSDSISTVLTGEKNVITPKYNPYRTLRAVLYGGVIFSPIGNKWYKFLHHKVKSTILNKFGNTLLRVSCDQLIFAPIGIPFYYFAISVMEGKSLHDCKLKVQENYKPTLLANWTVWPGFQLLNFYLVPVHLRLLSVNVISIFWNTFLSYRNSLAL